MKQYGNINNVLKAVSGNRKYTVPKSYTENFHTAYMTFLYQIVYDYEKEECVNLTQPIEDNFYGKKFLDMKDKDF